MNYVALGRRIRKARKIKNLTQEQLAEAVGLSLSFIGHIERGSRTASLKTVMDIANVLKTTPDRLLTDSIAQGAHKALSKDYSKNFEEIRLNLAQIQEAMEMRWN